MSSCIIGDMISLTRGDSFAVKVTMKNKYTGEEYTPQEGDVVRFAVKPPKLNAAGTEYVAQEPLIVKTIPNDTQILSLAPSDTSDLGFGLYDYDIEITMADGTVDTFISAAPFKLTKEVY